VVQVLRREFDLTNYGLACRASLHQRRRIDRYSRTNNDQILAAKRALTMAPGFHCNTLIEQQGDFFAQLLGGLGIGHRDARTAFFQEKGRCDSGLAETHDQDALVFENHAGQVLPQSPRGAGKTRLVFSVSLCLCGEKFFYRSFSVVRAKSANTKDAIQKRTMTFDSDHPSSSKWW
jgi:hypothetical protein